jgi:hypothetical protein
MYQLTTLHQVQLIAVKAKVEGGALYRAGLEVDGYVLLLYCGENGGLAKGPTTCFTSIQKSGSCVE